MPTPHKQAAEIKIEKGIPIPKAKSQGISAALRAMNVGDSIVMPAAQRGNLYACAKSVGVRLTLRSIDAGTVRVWRVA